MLLREYIAVRKAYKVDELPLVFILSSHLRGDLPHFVSTPRHSLLQASLIILKITTVRFSRRTHSPPNAMPSYAGFNFSPAHEELLAAAVTSTDPILEPSDIASILQIADWTAFRSFKKSHAQQAYNEVAGKPPSLALGPAIRETLKKHKDKSVEYNRLLRTRLHGEAVNVLLYGYVRTKRSTKEIAQVMNNLQLNLDAGPLKPLNAQMVERIYDWVEEVTPYKIEEWKQPLPTDQQKFLETTYRTQIELAPSYSMTVAQSNRDNTKGSAA
ncbi:MAG: hypothetical protein Q9204_004708 [Flavoplaca sp. TL-2023a]